MRHIFSLLVSLIIISVANAQIVNIPDSSFKAHLVGLSTLNTNGDTEIQVSEASSYTGNIVVSFHNISDLTGIEAFIALTYLDCSYNQLSSIDVSNNTTLTDLDCGYNLLDSLDISNNTALINLSCFSNQLSSLDLSNNIALLDLTCDWNNLTTLDITNNTVLTYLLCNHNQLSSLDVSNNTILNTFYCSYNLLNSLDVSNITALALLECKNNQLSSLDVINNMSLHWLSCENNQLTTLNLKNGNNINFNVLDATYNPNLFCIEVDDSTWSTNNWNPSSFYFDPQSFFSNDCTTDIKEESEMSEFKISPNPFAESFAISLPENVDNTEVKVYNILGKLEEVSATISNNKIMVSGTSLKAGIYLVEIREQNRLIGKTKIVKK